MSGYTYTKYTIACIAVLRPDWQTFRAEVHFYYTEKGQFESSERGLVRLERGSYRILEHRRPGRELVGEDGEYHSWWDDDVTDFVERIAEEKARKLEDELLEIPLRMYTANVPQ